MTKPVLEEFAPVESKPEKAEKPVEAVDMDNVLEGLHMCVRVYIYILCVCIKKYGAIFKV